MSNAPITRHTRLVTVRLPRDLADWADAKAKRDGLTLTQVITKALADARRVARQGMEGADA